MGSVTAARVAAPTLLDVIPSFERHLRAENKSPRTIQSYTEAVRRLHDFLTVKPGLGEGYDWVECGACGAGWQVAQFESVG